MAAVLALFVEQPLVLLLGTQQLLVLPILAAVAVAAALILQQQIAEQRADLA
jgi:hypothetical protein